MMHNADEDEKFRSKLNRLNVFINSHGPSFLEKLWHVLHLSSQYIDRKEDIGAYWASVDVICYNLPMLSLMFRKSQSKLRDEFRMWSFVRQCEINDHIHRSHLDPPARTWRFTESFSTSFKFTQNTTCNEVKECKMFDVPESIRVGLEELLCDDDIKRVMHFIRRDPRYFNSSFTSLQHLLDIWPGRETKTDTVDVFDLAEKLFGEDDFSKIGDAILEVMVGNFDRNHMETVRLVAFCPFFIGFYHRYGNGEFFRSLVGEGMLTFSDGFSVDENLNGAAYRLLHSKEGIEWVINATPRIKGFTFLKRREGYKDKNRDVPIWKYQFVLIQAYSDIEHKVKELFYIPLMNRMFNATISELCRIGKVDIKNGLPAIKHCASEMISFPPSDTSTESE